MRFAAKILILLVTAGSVFAFDAERAFVMLEAQCAFGPREPNSDGAERCAKFLQRELNFWADTVWTQSFSHYSERTEQTLDLVNIIAQFNPKANDRILLCAHWDTRPWADHDPDPKNHATPILGASDGASGVAVLLEAARQLSLHKTKLGIDIVLFDGEDYGTDSVLTEYCLGSQYYAQNLKEPRPKFGILLDLIGDKDLRIPIEPYSDRYARPIVEKVFAAAERVKSMSFTREMGPVVYDDHVPFLQIGIPVIDLIDFDYKYWHTIEDTPDKCSAQSLGEVGRVVMEVLREEAGK